SVRKFAPELLKRAGDDRARLQTTLGPNDAVVVAMDDPELYDRLIRRSGKRFLAEAKSGTFGRGIVEEERRRLEQQRARVLQDPATALDEEERSARRRDGFAT